MLVKQMWNQIQKKFQEPVEKILLKFFHIFYIFTSFFFSRGLICFLITSDYLPFNFEKEPILWIISYKCSNGFYKK